jgi:hypothetical protein
MKAWFSALPLVCLVGVAMAGPVEGSRPMDQHPGHAMDQHPGQSAAGPIRHKAPHKAHHGKHKHSARHYPRGDMRSCLDLKDNKAIIRCSEQRKKR